jgi:hypothetical protein
MYRRLARVVVSFPPHGLPSSGRGQAVRRNTGTGPQVRKTGIADLEWDGPQPDTMILIPEDRFSKMQSVLNRSLRVHPSNILYPAREITKIAAWLRGMLVQVDSTHAKGGYPIYDRPGSPAVELQRWLALAKAFSQLVICVKKRPEMLGHTGVEFESMRRFQQQLHRDDGISFGRGMRGYRITRSQLQSISSRSNHSFASVFASPPLRR